MMGLSTEAAVILLAIFEVRRRSVSAFRDVLVLVALVVLAFEPASIVLNAKAVAPPAEPGRLVSSLPLRLVFDLPATQRRESKCYLRDVKGEVREPERLPSQQRHGRSRSRHVVTVRDPWMSSDGTERRAKLPTFPSPHPHWRLVTARFLLAVRNAQESCCSANAGDFVALVADGSILECPLPCSSCLPYRVVGRSRRDMPSLPALAVVKPTLW